MSALDYFDFKHLYEKFESMNLRPSRVYSSSDGIEVEAGGAHIGIRSSHEITIRPAHGNSVIVWNSRTQAVLDEMKAASVKKLDAA